MTPNEKASTFIGWEPCVWEKVLGGQGTHCITHDSYSMRERRQTPAPDMSKPENYMRALEATGLRFSINRDYPALIQDGLAYACNIKAPTMYIAEGWYRTVGESAIKALAALYDAEHPE